MKFKPVPLWKEAPFIRYVIPFSTGILFQWNCHFPLWLSVCGIACCVVLTAFLNIRKSFIRFEYYYLFGACIYSLFFFLACILVFLHDIRNDKEWIGNNITEQPCLIVIIEEPVSEKARSYRALASVERSVIRDTIKTARGKLILYLKKDSSALSVKQGSILLICPLLDPIVNFKNSKGFDYPKYCALQNIYHQAYLKHGQYILLPGNQAGPLDRLLSFLSGKTIGTLRKYIKQKKEAGLAEALLIGYKDDLDKGLVQSYSNTGVVHIIAISGLHVGLIYAILLLVLKPLGKKRFIKWCRPFILLTALWLFTLLAGASPSVLRSALMFTVIILGNSINRKSSVYNSLAASAFLLLCYNPFWIYDTGFQLSYMAVLSLVIFMNPVYHLISISNKLLDLLWKTTSVTLAAQILTTPLCLYYFHQFPNMFLITNMIAVPLSGLILIGEIAICIFSFLPPLAAITGGVVEWLLQQMNNFIIYMERMPFALTQNIGISVHQAVILYAIVMVIAKWHQKRVFTSFLTGFP